MKQARQIAAEALCRMEALDSWSNLTLEGVLQKSGLDTRDRAFANALFYGVLSRRYTLDACIAAHSKTKLSKMDPAVRAALREALYQLLYMNSVPEHAAVAEAVNLVKRMRRASAASFVNAVLRSFLRSGKEVPLPEFPPEARLSVEYSCDSALAALLLDCFGEADSRRILEDSVTPPPTFLRVNTLRTTAAELIALLDKRDISAEPDPELPDCLAAQGQGALHELPEFQAGLFQIQDRSSQRCALLLGAAPGERVLDVCAAPGGKSFVLAECMQNQGELLCCDLYEHRTGLIEARAKELGIGIIRTLTADMSLPRELGSFDRILCDVPCSGYGAMRRRPEIKYKAPDKFTDLPALQYKLLETSANYCKGRAHLLYSTCTLNRAENDDIADRFLAEHPAFRQLARETVLPGALGGDGFFTALFQRCDP